MTYDGRSNYTGCRSGGDEARYCTELDADGEECGREYMTRDGEAFENRGPESHPRWLHRHDDGLCDVCHAFEAAREEDAAKHGGAQKRLDRAVAATAKTLAELREEARHARAGLFVAGMPSSRGAS
jgi:hypothetical protein